MNETPDDLPVHRWRAFREFAAEWAIARGRTIADASTQDALFEEKLRSLEATPPPDPELPQRLATQLRNSFEQSRLVALVREVETAARSLPHHCSRNRSDSLQKLASAWSVLRQAENDFSRQLPDRTDHLRKLSRRACIEGIDQLIAAETAAAECHKLLGGMLPARFGGKLLSRPKRLFFFLLSLPETVRDLAARSYPERYGRTLSEVIGENIPLRYRQPLARLLRNDAAAAMLYWLAIERNADEVDLGKLESALWLLPKTERKQAYAMFHELSTDVPGLNRLSAELRPVLRLLLDGNPAEFDAHRLHSDLLRRRFYSVCKRLIARDRFERAEVAKAYEARYEMPLLEELQAHLPKDGLRELASALLAGDDAKALAWHGRAIVCRQSDEWLGALMRGAKRNSFLSAYTELFGADALKRDIARRYRGRDREILNDLLVHPTISWGKLLWFSVAGPGTDEDALIALLERTTREKQEQLKQEYRAIWSERAPFYERFFPGIFGNLEKRLWLECAGDSWSDLKSLLESTNSNDTIYARMQRLYEHERSGRLLKRLDFFSHEGRVMDEEVERARAFYQNVILGRTPAETESLYFEILVRMAEVDCGIFRSLKHFIGNNLTTSVAGAGVFCSAVSVSLLSDSILPVMGAVGTTSAVLRFSLKALLKGRGYHRDEMLADLGFAVIDGLTLYMGRLFRRALFSGGAKFTSRLGLKTSIVQFVRRLHEVSAEVESETLRELAEKSSPEEPGLEAPTTRTRVRDEQFDLLMERLRRTGASAHHTA